MTQSLLRLEYAIHWILQPKWAPSAIWIWQRIKLGNLSRLMGHIKIDYENIFNTNQKTHVKWYFNPLSRAYHYLFTWRFGENWWEVDVNSKVMVILHVAFSPKTNCINISSIEPINFRWDQVCPILGHHLIIYLIILQNYYPSSPSQSTQWKIQKNLFKNLKSFFLWIVIKLN